MWKKWTVLLVLFCGALTLASFHGGRIAYMLLYLIPSLIVISFLYVCLVLFRFKFYQNIDTKTVVKNEPADYYFTLRNEDRFFYAGIEIVFLQDYFEVPGMKTGLCYSLEGGEGKEYKTKLFCHYRGEYAVGVGRFYISDYLGLFRIPYRIPEPLKVTVLPRITAWRYEKEILDEPQGRVRGQKSRMGEPDVAVRTYESGDSLRRIHRKASAKRGSLMSREEGQIFRQGLLVFLELKRLEGSEDERLRFEAMHPVYELAADLPELTSYQYAVVLTGSVNGRLQNWMQKNLSGLKSSIILVTDNISVPERSIFEAAGIGFFTEWIGKKNDI